MDFIAAIEDELGSEAQKEFLPLQPGDVPDTYADVRELQNAVGYEAQVSMSEGVRRFASWYREYYRG